MKLYNSLSGNVEEFIPIQPGVVNIYCCGVTVYDYAHLGHARCYITWDVLRRYLLYKGYKVNYVQNFTDIDDKIITRARKENLHPNDLTEFYIQAFIEDSKALNILPATSYPRATSYISTIQTIIQELISKGYAYSFNKDVLFSVRGFKPYGKLSNRSLDCLSKEQSIDFALWKGVQDNSISWNSPWGKGRPGWHIECSAMIYSLFNGQSIDIHTGGSDLKFPHHENEIAQSEALTHNPLANYWLHNGMVTVNGRKMGKSLGNYITIRDLLQSYNPNSIRLFVLQSNYTKPLDFSTQSIQNSLNSWNTLQSSLSHSIYLSIARCLSQDALRQPRLASAKALSSYSTLNSSDISLNQDYISLFTQSLDNNFNTSQALSHIFSLSKDINTQSNLLLHNQPLTKPIEQTYSNLLTLHHLLEVLGFDVSIPLDTPISINVQHLLDKRNAARANKDWALADSIRTQLLEANVQVVDLPNGTSITLT